MVTNLLEHESVDEEGSMDIYQKATDYRVEEDNILGMISVLRDSICKKRQEIHVIDTLMDSLPIHVIKRILCQAAYLDHNGCLGLWNHEKSLSPRTCLATLFIMELGISNMYSLIGQIAQQIKTNVLRNSKKRVRTPSIIFECIKAPASSDGSMRLGIPMPFTDRVKYKNISIDEWTTRWIAIYENVIRLTELEEQLNAQKNIVKELYSV